MILKEINFSQLKFLNLNKLSLSHLKYLESLIHEEQVPKDKFLRDLEKFGFVYEGEATSKGCKLYEEIKDIDGEVVIKAKKVKELDENFEKWWAIYPKHPSHGKWVSTRSLRVKKDLCQGKFQKILEEGTYTLDDLIRVLELEVSLRKQTSITRDKNELEFMKATESYLNSRQFEVFIDYEQKQKRKTTTI